MSKAASWLANAKGADVVKKLMVEFKVKTVNEIPQAEREDFLEEVRKLGGVK
jgi:hypothetical protein